jgi:plasmid stabilization system protein ParE
MGVYRVVWDKRAAIKRIEIGKYILEHFFNPIAAERIANAILDAGDDLSSSPQSFRVVDPTLGLRRRNVKGTDYFILFTIDERRKLVTITHIFHGKEDWVNKL